MANGGLVDCGNSGRNGFDINLEFDADSGGIDVGNEVHFIISTTPNGPQAFGDVQAGNGVPNQHYTSTITVANGATYYGRVDVTGPGGAPILGQSNECGPYVVDEVAELTGNSVALSGGQYIFHKPSLSSDSDPVFEWEVTMEGFAPANNINLSVPLPTTPAGIVASRTWEVATAVGVTGITQGDVGTGAINLTFNKEPNTDAVVVVRATGHLIDSPIGTITQQTTLTLGLDLTNPQNIDTQLEVEFYVFDGLCNEPANITGTSADLSGSIDGNASAVSTYSDINWWVSTDGGVTKQFMPAPMSDNVTTPYTFTGLTPETTYTYGYDIEPSDGNPDDITQIGTETCGTFDTLAAEGELELNCAAATNITHNSATLNATGANIPIGDPVDICWGPAGGPFATCLPAGVGNGTAAQTFSANVTGLAELTSYGYVVRQNAVVLATCDPSFTTLEAPETPGSTPMPLNCEPACGPNEAIPLPGQNQPCVTCGDGTGGPGGGGLQADVESLLLCDIGPDGELFGTALAVYEYDVDGNPVGAPTFINPTTGLPYVAQGLLQPCGSSGASDCGGPIQFCFTQTATGPTDHPGRSYDLDLQINPGFALDAITIDGTEHVANILWSVNDVDGEQFRAALEAFLAPRLAPATVTVTNPNAGTVVCGVGLPFEIHAECIRLDRPAPNIVDFRYNGGQDLVINPAYNTTPPTDLEQFQFYYLTRQDQGGNLNCSNTANRGWETNDRNDAGFGGRNFEIWSRGPGGLQTIEGATPTPRGTPIQEVAADGAIPPAEPTIWQTFEVLTAGTFKMVLVHGARDAGETHTIRLSTGDTDDFGGGDIINNVTNPPQVTNSGGNPAQAWTTFQQDVFLNPGVYTFSLTVNVGASQRGGLFTDMRAYTDAPNQIATMDTADDCVVTVDETSTTTDCQWWKPRCSNGDIVGWKNVESGLELTNAAFWGQVPAPTCCTSTGDGGGGGGSVNAGNLVYNYEICGTIGGVRQTLNRVIITDQSGGAIAQSFIGPDGGPVTPDTGWTVGACPLSIDNPTLTEVCVQTAAGTIESWTAIYNGATSSTLQGYRNSLGVFTNALPAGATIVPCQVFGPDVELISEPGCANGLPFTRLTTLEYDSTGAVTATTVAYIDSAGIISAVAPANFVLGQCPQETQQEFDHDFLCEPSPSTVRVLLVTTYDEVGTPTVTAYNFPELTPYAGVIGDLVVCEAAQVDPSSVEIDQYDTTLVEVCFINGPTLERWYTYERVIFNNTAPGTQVSRTRHWFNPLTNVDQTALPTGTPAACDSGVQVVESEEIGCALNVPWSRRRTGFFDANGQLLTVVYTFVDSAGNEQPTAPAGFLLGACPEIVATTQNETYTTQVRTVGPSAAFNIPVANLVSWSVRARTPGVDLTVNGTTITMDDGEVIDANAVASGAGGDGLGGLNADTVTITTGANETARVVYQTRTVV